MEVAPEPIDVARRERTFGWASLVRVVARVPLPIRAKQLFGSLAVAALLALVAVLGLVALGQSNSRGTELRRLQQQGVYEQLLLTDATQLKQLIDFRLGRRAPTRGHRDQTNRPPGTSIPPPTERGFLSAVDQQIGNEFNRLCLDAGARAEAAHCLGRPGLDARRTRRRTCRSPSTPSRRRCTGSSRA